MLCYCHERAHTIVGSISQACRNRPAL